MQKKKKCQNCGGAYIVNIPNNFFEREEHLVMKCPYCHFSLSMMIEDGQLITESDASPYLKNLSQKRVSTQPWVELLK
ncbi:hypothetical protein CEE45_15220 [Candidatus Heimdallarchaeota archaeon B3_Heim]|nr:MAG: hypothetical protein CEE45_15220 [Candidatus Heimdallarchaeota archaeon B3_Heim]